MTVQEAIETIKYASAFNREDSPLTIALDMAIEALEKQIPKKPTDIHEVEDGSFYTISFMCPSCDTAVIFQPYKSKYCKHCGQKLDWGD